MFRIGFGCDVHRLERGRPLILGGLEIEHHAGLQGHSDADVLTHAVIDALLGALGKGDIGRHFPDISPEFKDADSLQLLEKVVGWCSEEGYELNNLDAVIIAQAPRLAGFLPEMGRKLSEIFGVGEKSVNIKATTTEGLGFSGKEEGIQSYAVVSLVRKGNAPP